MLAALGGLGACFSSLGGKIDHFGDLSYVASESQAQATIDKLDTGDVLLFCSTGLTAKFVRASLSSRWDHVAFVRRVTVAADSPGAKTQPPAPETEAQTKSRRKCEPGYCDCKSQPLEGRLQMLEATASGVHVYHLEGRLARLREHYAVVGVRHLEGLERTPEMRARVREFIRSVCGRSYQRPNLRVLRMGLRGGVLGLGKKSSVAQEKQARMTEDAQKKSPVPTTGKKSQHVEAEGASSKVAPAPSSPHSPHKKIPASLVCSELVTFALMHAGMFPCDAFEAIDLGPNSYGTTPTGDPLNEVVVVPGVRYCKESILKYPGGVYDQLLASASTLLNYVPCCVLPAQSQWPLR